jgi:hypothetical protein
MHVLPTLIAGSRTRAYPQHVPVCRSAHHNICGLHSSDFDHYWRCSSHWDHINHNNPSRRDNLVSHLLKCSRDRCPLTFRRPETTVKTAHVTDVLTSTHSTSSIHSSSSTLSTHTPTSTSASSKLPTSSSSLFSHPVSSSTSTRFITSTVSSSSSSSSSHSTSCTVVVAQPSKPAIAP